MPDTKILVDESILLEDQQMLYNETDGRDKISNQPPAKIEDFTRIMTSLETLESKKNILIDQFQMRYKESISETCLQFRRKNLTDDIKEFYRQWNGDVKTIGDVVQSLPKFHNNSDQI